MRRQGITFLHIEFQFKMMKKILLDGECYCIIYHNNNNNNKTNYEKELNIYTKQEY